MEATREVEGDALAGSLFSGAGLFCSDFISQEPPNSALRQGYTREKHALNSSDSRYAQLSKTLSFGIRCIT